MDSFEPALYTGSYTSDNKKPVGIITERDIVRILGSLEPDLLKVPVRQLMSKPLITISSNSSIKDAMQTMHQV
ncbi:MAG: CBS domain-containing protein [Nitrososphaeraceae archaeon]